MERAGTQAPCPKASVDLFDAEWQHAIICDRRGDRPEMRYAGCEGIKGGGHRAPDSICSLYVPLPSSTLQGPIGSVRRFVMERTRYEAATKREIPLSTAPRVTHRNGMPIRAENRWLYPIDWQQLSGMIRFERAGRRCEQCRRPHLRRVAHLGDGRWWDADTSCWRSDQGKRISMKAGFTLASVRITYVVLACAHLDHDPGNSTPANLKALCQRCHMIHDAAEHRWQRWWNVFRLRALRDLYEDPRITRERHASHQ